MHEPATVTNYKLLLTTFIPRLFSSTTKHCHREAPHKQAFQLTDKVMTHKSNQAVNTDSFYQQRALTAMICYMWLEPETAFSFTTALEHHISF